MINRIRIFLQILLYLSLVLLYYFSTYRAYKMTLNNDKSFCGKIERLVIEEYHHKSSSSTDYYLIVQFDDVGRHDVSVSRTTYFKFNEGDRICFTYDADHFDKERWSFKTSVKDFAAVFIGFGLNGIIIILLIIAFVYWIFTGENCFLNE
jgi:hypothetical protein